MIWHRAWFSPDQFFVAGLLIMLLLGKFGRFLRDWSAPVVLYLSYEFVRGLIPQLGLKPHVYPMINFDNWVFGFIPTIKLQDLLFSVNGIRWYDYVAVLLYMSHFIAPMLAGLIFWLRDRNHFAEYITAFLFLSYAAFFTYVIFPAVPPWMASQQGYIPHVQEVTAHVMANLSHPLSLPTIYGFIGANLVAAVPSLHAAYPWLIFLFALRKIKLKSLILVPYVLGVWFAVIYLGEHYVFDVLVGLIYTTAAFGLVVKRNWIKLKLKEILDYPTKNLPNYD